MCVNDPEFPPLEIIIIGFGSHDRERQCNMMSRFNREFVHFKLVSCGVFAMA